MSASAFAYYRNTGQKADEEREGRIRSYATEHGIEILDLHADPSTVSLTAKGTHFSRMLVQMHTGEAGILILDELSSLSQDMIEQEIVLSHLRKWKIEVLCVRDPELSAEDSERTLLREFSGRIEMMKRMEGLRLEGERVASRKRTGRSEGAKRFGERPGEDIVLKQIHDLHRNGAGNTEISRRLNDQNIRPRRGNKWHPTTVANILDARRKAAERKARKGAKKPPA